MSPKSFFKGVRKGVKKVLNKCKKELYFYTSFLNRKRSSKQIKQSYQMGDQLGSGSAGKVLQATQISTGDQVAVKVMKKHLPLGLDPMYERQCLPSEVNVLRNVEHESILKLHEVFHDSKNVYVVTELCEGGNLLACLKRTEYLSPRKATSCGPSTS